MKLDQDELWETDMKSLRKTAKMFLNFIPKKDELIPSTIHHPFISKNPITYLDENKIQQTIDIFEDVENYQKYIKKLEYRISKCKTVDKILSMIQQPYKLYYLFLNNHYLNAYDYSNCLKDIWMNTKFPNKNSKVSLDELLLMLKKADTRLLMTWKERKKYNSLPDYVTIYRGTYKPMDYNSLSWTTDYDTAKFYAERFEEDGCILKAKINKRNIFAFFNSRNENEVVVNYQKIKDLEVEKILDIKI